MITDKAERAALRTRRSTLILSINSTYGTGTRTALTEQQLAPLYDELREIHDKLRIKA